MIQRVLDNIKRLPIDLGQGWYRHTTKAKLTAFQVTGQGHGRTVLDLGCGDGYWSKRLAKRGWQVTSADGFDTRHPTAHQINFEESLPFVDNQFDLIWCSEVIEHIKDVEQLVSEMRRITKPGGRIVTTTPNSSFWLYKILMPFGIKPADIQNPDHKQFFSLADIRNLFPSAKILGFFPYAIFKFVIRSGVNLLSPTFIIIERVKK